MHVSAPLTLSYLSLAFPRINMDNSKASNLGYIFKAKQGQKGVF